VKLSLHSLTPYNKYYNNFVDRREDSLTFPGLKWSDCFPLLRGRHRNTGCWGVPVLADGCCIVGHSRSVYFLQAADNCTETANYL